MSRFVSRKKVDLLPRLPLRGTIDLTYRCNNDCRHCWLRIPPGAPEGGRELAFDEIRRIADEARAMGCREWSISGGEPMLRPDFAEIFDYLTARAGGYTLNTNGTLITPAVARLLRRKGAKLLALYGATAKVHDHITRTPGSFEALERGMALLREAGAGFAVQIVPMMSNIHELEAMVRLAGSRGTDWRLGATWLYLSASGDPRRNEEIRAERLAPEQVVRLERSSGTAGEGFGEDQGHACGPGGTVALYSRCIAGRRDFHVDPYGGMSFCGFVKDPDLRCDLRAVGLERAWNELIPAMADKVRASDDYAARCGSCDLRSDCPACPVHAYLEHRDHSARVEYLCRIAAENRMSRLAWEMSHRRRFRIAGLLLDVTSDLPFEAGTFHPKFELFRTEEDGRADISLHHHFSIPEPFGLDVGTEVIRRPPWAVSRKGRAWIYRGIFADPSDTRLHRLMVFNEAHTRGRIYNPDAELFHRGGLDSLALLPSDQIVLARALPSFGGLFVHASGVVMNGRGLLFAGPSGAGKSTIIKLLDGRAEVLCDDRIIIRKGDDGFRVHGTWNHGEIASVSPGSAPLAGVFFLRQSEANRADRIGSTEAVLKDFLARLVRPLATADWWERALALAGAIVREVPFYDLRFDRSGAVTTVLEELTR